MKTKKRTWLTGLGLLACTGSPALAAPLPADLLVPSQYATIQAAIDAANTGDTVLVSASGSPYTGTGNVDLQVSKTITIKSTGGPNSCVIDCSNPSNPNDASLFEEGFRIFETIGSGAIAPIIDGFTIRNGCADPIQCPNTASGTQGAAIRCTASAAMVVNCIFEDNRSWGGGAVFANSPAFVLDACIIKNNHSVGRGGGVEVWAEDLNGYGGELIVRNCLVYGNTANDGGGGIHAEARDHRFEIRGCTVADNQSSLNPPAQTSVDDGGGIAATRSGTGTGLIESTILWNNQAMGAAGGEQLAVFYGPITVRYCDVDGGQAGVSTPVSTSHLEWALGNIDANPFFWFEYALQGSSPCVNAGNPEYVPVSGETDVFGQARAWGRVDMGSDETALCQVKSMNFCDGAVNSSGTAAVISQSGTLVHDGDLTLNITGAPTSSVTGLFYMSRTKKPFPFSTGQNCLQAPTKRLGTVTTSGGTATLTYDLGSLNSTWELVSGETRNFQFWYRDGANVTLFSDAIELTFCD